jgi:phosphoserine phosphatase RsbU/P
LSAEHESAEPIRLDLYAPFLEDSIEDLYENAPCGYISTLMDGTVVRTNATFARWTGYRKAEVVGQRRFQELLSVGGRIYHETHYAPMLRMQGAVREIAFDLICADGRKMPVLVNATVKNDNFGHPILVRTTIFDATERRRYEDELRLAKEHAEESKTKALELARTLQRSFIPPSMPKVPGFEVGTAYRPASDETSVGGDFYDVFATAQDRWAVVLGDVCGKGPEAAAVTALARFTVRAAAMTTDQPRSVLRLLNEALIGHESDRFCTVVYCSLDMSNGGCVVDICSAGHPLPVLVRSGGVVQRVGHHGELLGVFQDVDPEDTRVELDAGDLLALFTDGVTEARSDQEFYGDTRLEQALSMHRNETAGEVANGLMNELLAFQSGHPRDDTALLILKKQ